MKEYKKMTVSMIQKINDLYDQGHTCREVAEMTGYGHTTVYNYIWNPRQRGPKGYYMPQVDHETKKLFNRYYRQGMTLQQIAEATGYARETIRNHLEERRRRGPNNAEFTR